jgi:hypothetical protein
MVLEGWCTLYTTGRGFVLSPGANGVLLGLCATLGALQGCLVCSSGPVPVRLAPLRPAPARVHAAGRLSLGARCALGYVDPELAPGQAHLSPADVAEDQARGG